MRSRRSISKEVGPSSAYFSDFAMSYCGHIDELLRQLMERTPDEEIQEFVGSFYTQLSNRPESAAILSRLTPEAFCSPARGGGRTYNRWPVRKPQQRSLFPRSPISAVVPGGCR